MKSPRREAEGRSYYSAVPSPKIKYPFLMILALLAAWLGMTWWLHHDEKPGEHRNYSDSSR